MKKKIFLLVTLLTMVLSIIFALPPGYCGVMVSCGDRGVACYGTEYCHSMHHGVKCDGVILLCSGETIVM
ncbi:MAG: hypothetical protein ACEPO8_10340 [Rhodothermaceae bacterium]